MPVTDRLSTRFAACKAQGRAALITFVTAGDPDVAATPAILDALVAGGADIIELGMPFTDPMADGPAIELANLRSLGSGTKTRDVFALAADFRARHPDTPLVLMGYANPMLVRGADWFADQCQEAGVDGVICVDVPPEEDAEIGPALRAANVHPVRLATPTTDAQRLPAVLDGASGFLYHVAVAGVTGLEVSIAPGKRVQPLPEGDRYLGFLFARGDTAAEVEQALRVAHSRLDVVIVEASGG